MHAHIGERVRTRLRLLIHLPVQLPVQLHAVQLHARGQSTVLVLLVWTAPAHHPFSQVSLLNGSQLPRVPRGEGHVARHVIAASHPLQRRLRVAVYTKATTIIRCASAGHGICHRGLLWRQPRRAGGRRTTPQRGWARFMDRLEHIRRSRFVANGGENLRAHGTADRRGPYTVRVHVLHVIRIRVCLKAAPDDQGTRHPYLYIVPQVPSIVLPTLCGDVSDDRVKARVDEFGVIFFHDLLLNQCGVFALPRKC